jgi:hypothetical protein
MHAGDVQDFRDAVQQFENAVQLHAIVAVQETLTEAMRVANAQREMLQQSPAYGDKEFFEASEAIANAIEIYRPQ